MRFVKKTKVKKYKKIFGWLNFQSQSSFVALAYISLYFSPQDPNVKLIRELREENARLRAMLGQNMATVSTLILK